MRRLVPVVLLALVLMTALITPSQAIVGSVYRYTNITQGGPNILKTTGGQLHTITINTKGATGNLLWVYDSATATGTKIATIDTTVTFGTLYYDIVFGTGLTIVMSVGTAADVTVSWD